MYAVLSSVLGKWVDKQLVKKVSPRDVLKKIGGIQFTLLCVIVLLATCVPRGGLSLNPKMVEGSTSVEEDEEETQHTGSDTEHGEKKPQLDADYVHGHSLNKTGHAGANDKLAHSSL
jgi:hypothetical protein